MLPSLKVEKISELQTTGWVVEITCLMSIGKVLDMFLSLPRTVSTHLKLIPFANVFLLVRECSLKMPGFSFERFASFPVTMKKSPWS